VGDTDLTSSPTSYKNAFERKYKHYKKLHCNEGFLKFNDEARAVENVSSEVVETAASDAPFRKDLLDQLLESKRVDISPSFETDYASTNHCETEALCKSIDYLELSFPQVFTFSWHAPIAETVFQLSPDAHRNSEQLHEFFDEFDWDSLFK